MLSYYNIEQHAQMSNISMLCMCTVYYMCMRTITTIINRQVEQYNEEMKGEIMVIRRATYKAESTVQGLEKDKGRQDLFIDSLMDQVKRLQEEVVMSESKIGAQQGQTKEADDIMRDTAKVTCHSLYILYVYSIYTCKVHSGCV
jgi:hypothetical protein